MPVTNVTPKELKAKLDAGEPIKVIDVREDWEVATAHLDFATNLPMNEIIDRIDEVPKDVPVAIVCHMGARSAAVAQYLDSLGYKTLNVVGGIDRWSSEVDPSVPRYH